MNLKELVLITVIVNVALLSLLFLLANRVEGPESPSIPQESFTMAGSSKPLYDESSGTTKGFIAADGRPATTFKDKEPEQLFDEVDCVLRDLAINYGKLRPQATPVASSAGSLATGNLSLAGASKPAAPSKEKATSPSAETEGGSGGEVIVKRGDFLEKIARQHQTSVEAIKALNHLTGDALRVGQILRLPPPHKTTELAVASSSVTKEKEAEPKEGFYRLKSGDNPWKVAKQFHIGLDELLQLNKLDESSARNLKPGDLLKVR